MSFIVVNYNGAAVLRECLASIDQQSLRACEVIVVDNGSTDGSCDEAERAFARVTFLRCGENLGFAEANNRAIAIARGEFIALINNDATLEAAWGERMLAALRRTPNAAAAACRTLQAARPELIDSAGFDLYSCASVDTWHGAPAAALESTQHAPFAASASAAMYRRDAVLRVGGFDAEYFCYNEDVDLAVRLVLFGYHTVYEPDAVAYHVGSHTGKARSDFHIYHLRRNAEYLYWADMVGHLAWVHLPFHFVYEVMALGGALGSGQAKVVLRAKRDAFAKRRWIAASRRQLARELERNGGLRAARERLERAIRVGIPLFARFKEIRARQRKRASSPA